MGTGDGDGTVNHESLAVVERLWPKVASAPVTTKVFPGASHFGMLSDKRVLKTLVEYLSPQASLDHSASRQCLPQGSKCDWKQDNCCPGTKCVEELYHESCQPRQELPQLAIAPVVQPNFGLAPYHSVHADIVV